MKSRRPVEMTTANPGVRVGPGASLKPSQDTEQGPCPPVSQEVDLEVLLILTVQEVIPEVGAEDGTVEIDHEVAVVLITVIKATVGHIAEADPGAALMIITVDPGPTLMTAITAEVAVEVGAKGVTVTDDLGVIIGGLGVVDLTALTVKVTEAILITEAPVKAADTAEKSSLGGADYISI